MFFFKSNHFYEINFKRGDFRLLRIRTDFSQEFLFEILILVLCSIFFAKNYEEDG